MSDIPIYKRNGYEFQTVERFGNVSRAIGRKGNFKLHDITKHEGLMTQRWAYATEEQAKEKSKELTE